MSPTANPYPVNVEILPFEKITNTPKILRSIKRTLFLVNVLSLKKRTANNEVDNGFVATNRDALIGDVFFKPKKKK